MRGARLRIAASLLWLASCAAPDPPADPVPSAPAPPRRPAEEVPDRITRTGFPEAGAPSPIKGPSAVAARPGEPTPRRDPDFDELLKLQKEIAARRPESDDEKLRTALLLASAGEYEKAEQALSTVRARGNGLVPYLDLYLQRHLGNHKDAARLLADLNEVDRRVTGFVIDRAELCTKIRRYRDYAPAETDHVRPGGTVLLYVEPRNFTLNKSQDKHVLHLKYDWELYNDRSVKQAVPAWEKARPIDREDRNTYSGPVQEFYQSFALPLPENLAMGHYRVKVTVTDAHTGKNDRVYVPIFVTAVEK